MPHLHVNGFELTLLCWVHNVGFRGTLVDSSYDPPTCVLKMATQWEPCGPLVVLPPLPDLASDLLETSAQTLSLL